MDEAVHCSLLRCICCSCSDRVLSVCCRRLLLVLTRECRPLLLSPLQSAKRERLTRSESCQYIALRDCDSGKKHRTELGSDNVRNEKITLFLAKKFHFVCAHFGIYYASQDTAIKTRQSRFVKGQQSRWKIYL